VEEKYGPKKTAVVDKSEVDKILAKIFDLRVGKKRGRVMVGEAWSFEGFRYGL